MLRPVNVRAKLGPLLRNLATVTQRIDLIAPAIGEQWPVPSVELVQPSGLFEDVQPWTQIQVIGVAQNDLGLGVVLQGLLGHAFDRTSGPHRHENGGLDGAVIGLQGSGTGRRMRVGVVEGKLHARQKCHKTGKVPRASDSVRNIVTWSAP